MTKILSYKIGIGTDVGQVRKANEDYLAEAQTSRGHLFVVCDGMGGHVGGQKASRLATETIKDYFQNSANANPSIALSEAIKQANINVHTYGQENTDLHGMGTTVVAGLLQQNLFYYAHVGDSRIYLLREGKIKRLTSDHSLVQELVDRGEITNLQAETHPNKNVITRALGLDSNVEVTVCNSPVQMSNGDKILLCSDGLNGMISDKKIESLLRKNKTPDQIVTELISTANNNGGTDNITAEVIQFGNVVGRKAMVKYVAIVLPILLIGAYFIINAYSKKTEPTIDLKQAEIQIDSLVQEKLFRTAQVICDSINNELEICSEVADKVAKIKEVKNDIGKHSENDEILNMKKSCDELKELSNDSSDINYSNSMYAAANDKERRKKLQEVAIREASAAEKRKQVLNQKVRIVAKPSKKVNPNKNATKSKDESKSNEKGVQQKTEENKENKNTTSTKVGDENKKNPESTSKSKSESSLNQDVVPTNANNTESQGNQTAPSSPKTKTEEDPKPEQKKDTESKTPK